MKNSKEDSDVYEVYKKYSPDERLTLYMEKRTFYDDLNEVEPIDGIVVFDSRKLSGQYVQLLFTCNCRYGREDLDVLGVSFQKDLIFCSKQIYPELSQSSETLPCEPRQIRRRRYFRRRVNKHSKCTINYHHHVLGLHVIHLHNFDLSPTQRRITEKLGSKAHPFRITLPPASPSSVTIYPIEPGTDKVCGVTYEISAFISNELNLVPVLGGSVSMLIRKLTAVTLDPEHTLTPCKISSTRNPAFQCNGEIRMSLELPKPIFWYDEEIPVDVEISNYSRFTVRKLRLAIIQRLALHMITKGSYRTKVDKLTTRKNLPIRPNTVQWRQRFILKAVMNEHLKKHGVAMDGILRQESHVLASSTLFQSAGSVLEHQELVRSVFGDKVPSSVIEGLKDQQGLTVSYYVRAQCYFGASYLEARVPFLLLHTAPPISERQMERVDKTETVSSVCPTIILTAPQSEGESPAAEEH